MVFFLIEKEKIKEYNVNVLGGEPKNILKRRKYKMKKMIKKVIVAVLAMAMALGMMTVATSAADGDKTITVILSDATNVSKVLLDPHNNGGGTTISSAATVTEVWGRNMYEFTKDPSDSKVWTITASGNVDIEGGAWANFQIVIETTSATFGYKYWMANADSDNQRVNAEQWNANDELYFSLDVSKTDWPNVLAETTDPRGITADEVETAIAAIGTVALTEECKALIDAASAKVTAYAGDTSDIDNYATYTAAKARWDELVEDGAGELKIHVKYDWDAAAVYTYGVNDGEAHAAGGWPGTVPTANANNDGWKDVTVTIESAVNVIVNNNGNGEQVETKYVSAGEYWITVSSTPNGADLSISPDAPDGWSTGVVTPPPTGDNDDDTTTPSSPAGDKDDESAGDGEEGGSSAEDTPAGDNSMVAIYAILAVLAAGVVTVAVAKRRAIEE